MESYEFRVVEGTEAEKKAIETILNQRNAQLGITWNPQPLTVVMRAPDGKLLGGLTAHTHFGWLHIKTLAVAEAAQGKGCGTKLVEMAETAALSRGCGFAHVDTFSFQALGFYQKLGYAIYGTLENYPFGHKRYYLKKPLLT